MEDSAPGQDGEAPDTSPKPPAGVVVVDVAAAGEVVLNVRFETSAEVIRAARKAYQAAVKKPGAPKVHEPRLSPMFQVAYRVDLAVLRKHSAYFDNLLGNTQFAEARLVQDFLADVKLSKTDLSNAKASSLPWISITDDDEATKSAGREMVFEDMLRILHELPTKTGASAITMLFVSNLAVLADRFDCQVPVSRHLAHGLKFKWPMTSNKPLRIDGVKGPSLGTEQVLRQKILASWLLQQPLRLAHSTREIIMRGSSAWSAIMPAEEGPRVEAWWDLPDDLEGMFSPTHHLRRASHALTQLTLVELQHRRECILNTIASVQRHFLALYSSRDRQCTLGYDSSAACDFFQLGQMLKFLTSKDLLAPVDFGPSSLDALPDASTLDLEQLLATLRQCPNYQLDKHHTNCGFRTRLEPIIEYIQAMLSSNAVAITHAEWKSNRETYSWALDARRDHDGGPRQFRFTRGMAGDQRFRMEGSLHAEKMARALFTADSWDWSPEY